MTTTPQSALLSDDEIIRHLEAAGVNFQRFMGGIAGTKDCWTTSGSQDARKIVAGVRAILAKLQDGRNTPFGREAEKLADNYLDLQAQYADALAKLQAPQEPVQTPPAHGIGLEVKP